jgi:L-gulono-1,4-lactone dehydrogenase
VTFDEMADFGSVMPILSVCVGRGPAIGWVWKPEVTGSIPVRSIAKERPLRGSPWIRPVPFAMSLHRSTSPDGLPCVRAVKRPRTGLWQNWARTEATFPARVHEPADTEEVRAVVREVAARCERLTLVGSGHSWSAVARPDGDALSLARHAGGAAVDSKAGTVTVRAGTRLRDLSESLASRGLALSVLGTSSAQTIAGAIATATHGSGVRHGNLSTLVHGLELVTADGDVVSITEPQNSDQLPAVRASLGLLGVVTSVTLACEPAFNLRLVERPSPLDAVLSDLDGHLAEHDYFKFWWWPHTDSARTWEYDRTSEPDDTDRLRRLVAEQLLFVYPAWLGLSIASALPSWIPSLARSFTAHFNRPRSRVDRSDHAFTFPVPIRHFEMEYAIPRRQAAEAVRELRDLIERERHLVDFVVEVRFTAGDDIWLSPAYGRETCYIGSLAYRPQGCERYFRSVERLMRSFEGRPHLGKLHYLDAKELVLAYPRVGDFLEVRGQLDPDRLFGNRYLDGLLTG